MRKRREKEWTVLMHGGKKESSTSRLKRETSINCGFTWAQLQELQHQSLIYRHIVARLPVPLHLLLPIWETLSPNLATSFHNQYPSCESLLFICLFIYLFLYIRGLISLHVLICIYIYLYINLELGLSYLTILSLIM